MKNMVSRKMNETERFLTEILLNAIQKILRNIKNEKLRLICQANAEQIVPEIANQIAKGQLDFTQVPVCLSGQLQQELNAIVKQTVFAILDKIASRLPEGKAKTLFVAEVKRISKIDIEEVITNDEWQHVLAEQVKQYAAGYAKEATHEALDKAKEYLPESQYKAVICDNAEAVATDIIESVANGADMDELLEIYTEKASQAIKANAQRETTKQINKAIDEAVDYLADKAKDKGRGKSRSRYNKKVTLYTERIRSELKDNAGNSVARILNGENFETVAADFASRTAKNIAQDILIDQTKEISQRAVRNGVKRLHISGKGSRKVNRRIDQAGVIVSDSLTSNISNGIIDVMSGEKELDEVVTDVAVNTAKDSARRYMEEHGAELAKEAIETITRKVAGKVGNQAVKMAITKAGTSLANVNTVTAVAGAIYDIGKSFKDFLNGDITKAELLRQIGEKGSAACLSSVYASVGAVAGSVAGPIGTFVGAAIGSMVGYVASSMLYGSVLQAFEAEEAARVRAEQTHAFCEAAIRRMKAERAEFERQAEILFQKREAAFAAGFRQMEAALLDDDFDRFSSGLNEFANSFGQKLQFTTFEEFDTFMQSDEAFDL